MFNMAEMILGSTGEHGSMTEEGHRCFAAFYDRFSGPMEHKVMRPLRQRFAQLTGTVLEIGAGTGANLPYYSTEAEVVGIEPNPFMLKRAQAKLEELHRSSITLQQAGAEAIPFGDQSFDHVVSTLVLCTVSDPEKALSEIRRVLKTDGQLHFIEHVRAEGWRGRGQDIIRPIWGYIGAGCRPNRSTLQTIEKSGFRVDSLEQRTIQLGIPLVSGTARPSPT